MHTTMTSRLALLPSIMEDVMEERCDGDVILIMLSCASRDRDIRRGSLRSWSGLLGVQQEGKQNSMASPIVMC